jgi:hypothetical protein
VAPLVVSRAATPNEPEAPVLLLDAARRSQPPSTGELVARQVSRFFAQVEKHQELLQDLQVPSMDATNAGLAGADYGEAGERAGRILSYVSVAPPPRRFPLLDLGAAIDFELIQAWIYATLYDAAKSAKMAETRPTGPLIAPFDTTLLDDPVACDGVVPARSQTLHGVATGMVLGDHLDVVGSFDGGTGANVMRSGSKFTGERFEALWRDIATHLG